MLAFSPSDMLQGVCVLRPWREGREGAQSVHQGCQIQLLSFARGICLGKVLY